MGGYVSTYMHTCNNTSQYQLVQHARLSQPLATNATRINQKKKRKNLQNKNKMVNCLYETE